MENSVFEQDHFPYPLNNKSFFILQNVWIFIYLFIFLKSKSRLDFADHNQFSLKTETTTLWVYKEDIG